MNGPNDLFLAITETVKKLFDREEVRLDKRTQDLVAKHRECQGSPDGFRHLGLIYSSLTSGRSRGTYDRLHQSLVPELEQILEERRIVDEDRVRIRQAIAMATRDCHSPQDMRDALPNALTDVFPGISKLERTRPEAYTLAENPKSYTQYMKLREKIEFYVAARLLY